MKALLGLMLGILCLPLFTGCDEVACGSQEDFTPKWSALAASQTLAVDPATPVTPVKPGICSNCNGKGKVGDGTIMLPCTVCGGDGRIEAVSATNQCANPDCNCENCKGKDCTCEPLKVGPPPESSKIVPIAGLPVVHEDPVPQVCPTLPKKTAPVATGHWQTVQSCGRGGCSVSQVWVPNAPQAAPVAQGACANGSCGTVRRGLFGRRR